MTKLTCFYSSKYHDKVTHTDHNKSKEYFLDTVIKPYWVYSILKENSHIIFKQPVSLLSDNDLYKVHSHEYINSLKKGVPIGLANSSGLRWVPKLFEATINSVSGYYASALQSLKDGVSGSLSTNFHHAKQNQGSGFCVLNGIAVTAKKLLSEKIVSKILILDCDSHYGDGNADIFKGDKRVQIFDIYGGFHTTKTSIITSPNTISCHVNSAEEYFSKLNKFSQLLDNFKPEIVLYEAGMDIWINSRIGKIKGMNEANIQKRESFVFTTCNKRNIPIAFLIGGGYVKYKDEAGKLLSNNIIVENRQALAQIHNITLEEAFKAI